MQPTVLHQPPLRTRVAWTRPPPLVARAVAWDATSLQGGDGEHMSHEASVCSSRPAAVLVVMRRLLRLSSGPRRGPSVGVPSAPISEKNTVAGFAFAVPGAGTVYPSRTGSNEFLGVSQGRFLPEDRRSREIDTLGVRWFERSRLLVFSGRREVGSMCGRRETAPGTPAPCPGLPRARPMVRSNGPSTLSLPIGDVDVAAVQVHRASSRMSDAVAGLNCDAAVLIFVLAAPTKD
jgi:hypothetical protein